MKHRLVILSGPSCVGKSPLKQAFTKLYPNAADRMKHLVLYDDRMPRPGEKDGVDYHFRSRSFIEKLRHKKGFLVKKVRGDLMALDIKELIHDLATSDVFYEGNPFMAKAMVTHQALRKIPKLSVFLSPLSKEEIKFLRGVASRLDLETFITQMMRRKLLVRTQKQKGFLARTDLKDIEVRAKSAFKEMREAHHFDHVIVNHDGEDSDHWESLYYPLGDARQATVAFARLLEGKTPKNTGRWSKQIL